MNAKNEAVRYLNIIVIQVVFVCFIFFTQVPHASAYDTDNNGKDSLTDSIIALGQQRLKESVHTLQVLTGMNPSPELYFTRSDNGHLVTDLTEELMWQDYALAFKDEADGVIYCNQSALDNYNDWRLPTFEELKDFFKAVDRDTSFDLNNWGTHDYCTASVAIGGYVKTPRGAEEYGGEVGDRIYFSGPAAARCVRATP